MKLFLCLAFFLWSTAAFAFDISPNLTAVYDAQRQVVKLKWQHNNEYINSFVLQKSADNYHWSDLYQVQSSDLSSSNIEKYTDRQPDPQKNYYRLKIIMDNGGIEFTQAIMVIMGNLSNSWVMFPVPVTSILNLQYTGSEEIPGVVSVFIANSQGQVLCRLRSSSLVRTIRIPVSNLGKGIYDVRIVILDKVVWNQRFVK